MVSTRRVKALSRPPSRSSVTTRTVTSENTIFPPNHNKAEYSGTLSLVSNSLTFKVGRKVVNDEGTPDEYHEDKETQKHRPKTFAWPPRKRSEAREFSNPPGRTAEEQQEHTIERVANPSAESLGLASPSSKLPKVMLMPTEPPALANSSGGADEREKTSIAKFITISYAKPPLIYLAVAGLSKPKIARKPGRLEDLSQKDGALAGPVSVVADLWPGSLIPRRYNRKGVPAAGSEFFSTSSLSRRLPVHSLFASSTFFAPPVGSL
ncbi:hypothetical protein MBM_05830 [Drepanopeziza brunnea f. sp. 'multigermtubi' MB_m1]|uniref:Uncharacterized protein n=1 Tax=Marssonina brunnea f. sp. multigermtubi (strain MB_m1) TaxID=1072389 RepID=K1XTF2_MARBU|nr:uncharacterized protein MBM_05830 [Drepanopeziza brunnea f. sp. 'multigermtubi' MB_m1]EKD15819.1 hypothetical protein MBM_05830 [Drepanopeziza brunnea f. sp. 'multigermtubi' MB_m1]